MEVSKNKASKFKHPALAHQTLLEDIQTYDENNQEALEGWETFTPEQKAVLAALPWHSSLDKAIRFVRKNPNSKTTSFITNARRKPGFMAAAKKRKEFSTSIARNMIADMESMVGYHLMYYLTDPDVSDIARIKAMEMVMRIQGEQEQGKDTMPAGLVNYGTVNMVANQQNVAPGIERNIATDEQENVD
jgi:hypothetical protein